MNEIDLTIVELRGVNATPKSPCKGLFFRGRESIYIDKKDSFIYQQKMIPLKKKSCKGCPQCEWLRESLKERYSLDCAPIIENLTDGATYKLYAVEIGSSWKTGIVDSWELHFRQI